MQLPGATQAENDADEASLLVEHICHTPEHSSLLVHPLSLPPPLASSFSFSTPLLLSLYSSLPLSLYLYPTPTLLKAFSNFPPLAPLQPPLFCNYLFTQCLFDIEAESKVLIAVNVEEIEAHFPMTALTREVWCSAAVSSQSCSGLIAQPCEALEAVKSCLVPETEHRLWESTV